MQFVFILHVIVLYLLGLLGNQNIMRVQCSAGDSVNSRGGGGKLEKISKGWGVEESQDPGGWPKPDNDILQGSDPR